MLNTTTHISECCEAPAEGEIVQMDNDEWGLCSRCHDWTPFEEAEVASHEFVEAYTIPKAATDKERLQVIAPKCGYSDEEYGKVERFDPRTISWVTDRIAVTSREGVAQALEDGHFVINTAEEIVNKAHVKIPVKVGSGQVMHQLNSILNVMDKVMTTTDQKIVVHCAMGMERSVLSIVWFMANTWGMTLEQAFNQVKAHRPIALNRLNWIAL